MSFSEAVKSVFSNYAVFEGRARRSEYWYFFLLQLIVNVVVRILVNVSSVFSILAIIWALATLVPGLAVAVRRLHDTGKSGWFILLGLIPVVGGIIVLVFMVSDSLPGDNQYGPNPKEFGGSDQQTI